MSLIRKTEEEEEMEGMSPCEEEEELYEIAPVKSDDDKMNEKRNYLFNKIRDNIHVCEVYEDKIKGLRNDSKSKDLGEVMSRLVKFYYPVNCELHLAHIRDRKESVKIHLDDDHTILSLGKLDDKLVEVLDLYKRFYSELKYQKILNNYRNIKAEEPEKLDKLIDYCDEDNEDVIGYNLLNYVCRIKEIIKATRTFQKEIQDNVLDFEPDKYQMEELTNEMDQDFQFTFEEYMSYANSRANKSIDSLEIVECINCRVSINTSEYDEFTSKVKIPFENLLKANDLLRRVHKKMRFNRHMKLFRIHEKIVSKYEIE